MKEETRQRKIDSKNAEQINDLYIKLDERKRHYGLISFKPQEFQQPLLDGINKKDMTTGGNHYRFLLYQGGNGSGKCWAKGTEFITYDGEYKRVEDVTVGDVLMGPDSKPRNVLGLGRGQEEMFTISSERDEPFTVNKSHILSLIQRRRNRKNNRVDNEMDYAPEGELVNITVGDYIKKSDRWKSEAKLWRPNKIDFNASELPLSPYYLGLWLGDGSSRGTTITNVDEEINDYLYEFAESENVSITRTDRNNIGYNLVTAKGQPNPLLKKLQALNVIGNKHIPKSYKTASFNDRLSLIAGLIDSDGYVDGGVGYVVTQKRENIIDELAFVCRSVGLKVRKRERISKMKRKDGTIYECDTYSLFIQGDRVFEIPLKVERKKYERKQLKTNPLVTGFKVHSIGLGDYYGFELDGDQLCLNKEFIVQHNTCIAMYAVACLALGLLCHSYNIPFIGSKKKIYIGTKSGSNLKGLEDYLLGDYSVTRIPPEAVKNVVKDNGCIKEIHLHNGCRIVFFTYDQGRERIQGTNGDLYVFDEEPTKADIFYEGLARLRTKHAQAIYSFTPLSGHTAVYEYFYEQKSENVKAQSFKVVVNSLENKHGNHTWAEGLTEHERKMRIEGLFVPPSGLVYSNFNRLDNTIEFFHPNQLGNVKYYGAVDFGFKHPLAFAFIAVDEEENIYVFDLIYGPGILIGDLVKQVLSKKAEHNIQFEYIVADSASLRERSEMRGHGMSTVGADKHSKGENNTSNRRAGIMKVNEMLSNGKIFIADHLKDAIKEMETHHYKENGLDGAVEKTNDDFLDALRYFIFAYKAPKYINKTEGAFEKKYGTKYSRNTAINTRKPY